MRVAVVGGGPIGLEAALYGVSAGLDVTLFERGRLAENVRHWGHVGLFTEWARNRSPLALALLEEQGYVAPPADFYATGAELAAYVVRLAALPQLRGRLCVQTEVLSITRQSCLKSDFYGEPERRAQFPFRVMTRGVRGETVRHFDAVIDATGVYATPNPVGDGGSFCPGEAALQAHIDYHLPDVTGNEEGRFGNKHTIVVGSGHSAASTALAVASLRQKAPRTRLTWVVRRGLASHGELYWLDPEDLLSGRRKLGDSANALVASDWVDFRARTTVESIARRGGGLEVKLSDGETLLCDNLVAHTGFRPDPTLWRELQITEHPATGGPFHLAEVIMETNRAAGVGLSTGYAEKSPPAAREGSPPQSSDIRSGKERHVASPNLVLLGEPNFFVAGIKSYGRDAGFLMQNGFRQVRDIYRQLTGDASLDLYQGKL